MSLHDQYSFAKIDEIILAGAVFSQRPKRLGSGLISGTRVETADGWKSVELIRTGETVHTYDGGLQPVKRIERTVFGAEVQEVFPEGLLMVPGGALDNCDAFYLLPEQHVLLESTVAAEILGNPAALVPAAALEGYRGIMRVMPVDVIEVITLLFDDEEVVFANTGAMMQCAPRKAAGAAMRGAVRSAFFQVLTMERARALVALMAAANPWENAAFAEAA